MVPRCGGRIQTLNRDDVASVPPLCHHRWHAKEQPLIIIYPGTIHSYNAQTTKLEKIGQESSTIMLPLLAH